MPQMAPLSWLSLYIMFSITLMLFCVMNYYIFMPQAPKKSKSEKMTSNSLNWKW
uniref:ATP synthase F0 subunit 8 n=1 Tax=Gymnopternus congruens TaxID=2954856 RepID=UPI002115C08D|nr:ATP synthase F0 subunit 8 [Gymnopternus congruens]USW06223.1 ATP synthase F0 subunit 8 [Gymnopternus congruens]